MNMTVKQKDEIIDILENLPYWDTCPQDYKDKIPELVKALSKVNNSVLADDMGSLSRFEKFFRNEHPSMFYEGDKMGKSEILKLVEEFFKTVKDNDEGMWKDGIDGNTMGIGL